MAADYFSGPIRSMPDPISLPRPPIRSAGELIVELQARTDEFIAGPREPQSEARPQDRRGRKLLWWDGLVSNISESFITNFVNPFALALAATNTQIGWLSSLSNLASALALFPGARLEERTGRRKRIVVLTSGGAGRLLLLAIALAPALFHGQAAIYAVIALVALRAFFTQLGYPAWSSLVADLVPASIRGRYFASRNIALAIAALIFTPLAGKLAASLGLPQGYQVGFFIAGLIGFISTAIFARIPEPPLVRPPAAAEGQHDSAWSILRQHPKFAGFTAVAFLWNLALAVAAPFFSVYLVRDLGANPFLIGLVAAVFSLANIVGQRIWGQLNDRRGAAWVMRVTGFMIPAIPILWSLVPNPWYLLAVESFSGFMWAGYSLANFNLLLGLAPPAQRARFTAIYQVAVFGAACVGPLVGSALANAFSIRLLFWVSAIGRLVASTLFLFAVRDEHG